MKTGLMSFYDRMILRKRHVIETSNGLLKNKVRIVHSRHRSMTDFLVSQEAVPRAYCFFDNKPGVLAGYVVEESKQLRWVL